MNCESKCPATGCLEHVPFERLGEDALSEDVFRRRRIDPCSCYYYLRYLVGKRSLTQNVALPS